MDASPVFDTVLITRNYADTAGGVYIISRGSATFVDCVISDHAISGGSSNGAGVYLDMGANPVFLRTTISNNTAPNHGGGMYITGLGTRGTFRECHIAWNTALLGSGGGVKIETGAKPWFDSTQIRNNKAISSGGGVSIQGTGIPI